VTQRSVLVVSWFVLASSDNCGCSSDLTDLCCHRLARDVSLHKTGSPFVSLLLVIDSAGLHVYQLVVQLFAESSTAFSVLSLKVLIWLITSTIACLVEQATDKHFAQLDMFANTVSFLLGFQCNERLFTYFIYSRFKKRTLNCDRVYCIWVIYESSLADQCYILDVMVDNIKTILN